MANTQFSGPLSVSGNLSNAPSAYFGSPIADPNADAGPSKFYQGTAILDPRMWYAKDKVTGFTGVEQGFIASFLMKTCDYIPPALAANNIAAAQGVTSGTAMTLAASSLGVVSNIPIHTFSNSLNNGTVVTAALGLDFGFSYVATTAGSTTVTVIDSSQYWAGMPLVIANVGNAGGTIPLLTNVVTLATATTVTIATAALATSTGTAVGTGDLWGPSEIGFPTPLAAYPFIAGGPGLFLDQRQASARGVRVVGVSGSTGGTFTVRGYDIYGQAMTATITVAAGVATGWSLKAFKYIVSVTPNFTDTTHNYTVGTSDVFGFAFRSGAWEETKVCWAGSLMTSNTGWVAGLSLLTTPTALTADNRGTIQLNTSGAGTGIGTTATNGSLAGITISGNRLSMGTNMGPAGTILSTQAAPQFLLGATQF